MSLTDEQLFNQKVAGIMAADAPQTSANVDPSPESRDLISLLSPISHSNEEWPTPIADEGFHGLAGEFVRLVKPHSEADPAALDLWPDTGKALGLGRNSTYDAARRGDIPTIRIGRRILVPKAALNRLLESAGKTVNE